MKTSIAAFAMLVLAIGSQAVRGDAPATAPAKVDNPLFVAWAKCDVGASCTCEADVPSPDGKKVHAVQTAALTEKNADSVAVHHTLKMGGHELDLETETVTAKVDASDAKMTGEADVKAMDKTFKCKVYEMTGTAAGNSPALKMTVYMNDAVPRSVIKTVLHLPDGTEVDSVVTAVNGK